MQAFRITTEGQHGAAGSGIIQHSPMVQGQIQSLLGAIEEKTTCQLYTQRKSINPKNIRLVCPLLIFVWDT